MKTPVQQRLLKVLEKIDRPGTFCTCGRLPSVVPGLEVAGLGMIALPLDTRQAEALKGLAHQAPYGKGTRTLVDTNVRRVWEVDADQVTLANPEWPSVVKEAVGIMRSELGLEQQTLETHLYKLLLYEAGSFFLPHRDGEKLDRMVATLVIVLPSSHEGGELIVRHEGQETVVDFSPQSAFFTRFAAFYADCEHEIRPVTKGFRLALVYNVTLEKSKSSITAPSSQEHVAEVAKLLGKWRGECRTAPDASEDAVAPKLAMLLDHQYTKAGLTCDALKGIDRAQADVLFAAAREAGCDASLALVTYWVTGSAEPVDPYHSYGQRRRYSRYDDEDDECGDDDDGSEHVMGEVIESGLSAENFSDAEGNPLAYGCIPLDDEELVTRQTWNESEPDEEDFEGYTGNAGMTLERWYHRAAVIVWPAESRFDVLCGAGVENAVGGLELMVRRWKQAHADKGSPLKRDCLEFARRIIARWPERDFVYGNHRGYDEERPLVGVDEEFADESDGIDEADDDFSEDDSGPDSLGEVVSPSEHGVASNVPPRPLLALLADLDDPSLIAAWIRNVLARDVGSVPGKTLGDVCQRHGWTTFSIELLKLFDNTSNETLERDALLLADWSLRQDGDDDRQAICSQLAGRLMSAVERWDLEKVQREWRARKVQYDKLLPMLTQTFLVLNEPKLLERLLTFILDRPLVFDLTTVQVPALLTLETWLKRSFKSASPVLGRWLAAVVEELERRKAQPPKEPKDWRRESTTGCECADCKELTRFLKDPGTATLRLPLAENRRRHLHRIIDGKQLDTTHVTERRGRPYTLVCTKTKASYERALKAHEVDLDHLEKMRKLQDWHNGLASGSSKSGKLVTKPKGTKRT